MGKTFIASLIITLALAISVTAGEADIVKVSVSKGDDGLFRFAVTVAHDDKNTSHFSDWWDVVGPDGKILGVRILRHPHVREKPFTRYLNDVKIPKSISVVTIRAHDSVHEYGGREMEVKIPH